MKYLETFLKVHIGLLVHFYFKIHNIVSNMHLCDLLVTETFSQKVSQIFLFLVQSLFSWD